MLRITHLAFTLTFVFMSALARNGQSPQTASLSPVNFAAEPQRGRIAAQGEVSEMSLEVLNAAGEVVFDSGTVNSKELAWELRDHSGARVSDGIYMCTVTYRTASGKIRKRIEQVMISAEKQIDG